MCLKVCLLFKDNHSRGVQRHRRGRTIKLLSSSGVGRHAQRTALMMNSVGKRMSHTRSKAMLFRRSTKPGTETDKEGANHKAPPIVLAVHYLGFGWECLCLNVQAISFEVLCQVKRCGRLIRSKSLCFTRVRVKVQNRSPGDKNENRKHKSFSRRWYA